jgi:hypothetical protein
VAVGKLVLPGGAQPRIGIPHETKELVFAWKAKRMRVVADRRELEFPRLLEEAISPVARVRCSPQLAHRIREHLAKTLGTHLGVQHHHGPPLAIHVSLEWAEMPAREDVPEARPSRRGFLRHHAISPEAGGIPGNALFSMTHSS